MSAISMFTGFGFFGGQQHGGAVSKGKPVLVGERGPELFVPNTTGQITQNARGTGGGSTNVNFSITTLDASGFSEMLVQNRGTISAIINQAVNERGASNIV
jgi:phage-related minor tail protein